METSGNPELFCHFADVYKRCQYSPLFRYPGNQCRAQIHDTNVVVITVTKLHHRKV